MKKHKDLSDEELDILEKGWSLCSWYFDFMNDYHKKYPDDDIRFHCFHHSDHSIYISGEFQILNPINSKDDVNVLQMLSKDGDLDETEQVLRTHEFDYDLIHERYLRFRDTLSKQEEIRSQMLIAEKIKKIGKDE